MVLADSADQEYRIHWNQKRMRARYALILQLLPYPLTRTVSSFLKGQP